jgi:hypothetical protein
MTIKTLKFYGRGYGSTPATISVTQNGVNVYTGAVTTFDEPRADMKDPVVLFESTTTVDFEGLIPMSIEVTNGSVVFAWIAENYATITNPIFSEAQLPILRSPLSTNEEKITIYSAVAVPPFSTEEIELLYTGTEYEKKAILADHNASLLINGGPDQFGDINIGEGRANVAINGIPKIPLSPRPEDKKGTWNWEVSAGSVLTYDLIILASI